MELITFICTNIDDYLELNVFLVVWVPVKDSSSGNTSDMESQEGGCRQGPKSTTKDRTSAPGKDSSLRNSLSHKATLGYKVEDKTT